MRTVRVQDQQDALAERIAAGLRMRKKLGAERRLQQRRLQERAFAGRHGPQSDPFGERDEPDLALHWNSANGLSLG